MKINIIFLLFVVVSLNANAFYTTFDQDVESLRKSINSQEGSMPQKEKFLKKVIPVVKQAREEAYSRVASECIKDLKQYCPKAKTLDSKVKCLSEHKRILSKTCTHSVEYNFRKQ